MKNFTLLTLCLGLSITLLAQSPYPGYYKSTDQILTDPFLLDENISNTTLTFGQRFPKVAFDGDIYLVAWRDFRSQSNYNADVYACRVDEDGNPLDMGGIPICTAQRSQYPVDVIYDGTNFVVVWVDERDYPQTEVYFARINSNGEVLDPDGIQATTGSNMVSWNNPCAGTGNGTTLISWCEDMITGPHAVKCMRIDNSGNILDPDGFVVSDTLNDDTSNMSIGFDGTNFLVVWESGMYSFYDDILGARISQSGEVLDPNGFIIAENPDDQLTPSVCFGENNFLVTWSDSQGEDEDIYGNFVSPDGTVTNTDGFVISSAINDQKSPRITFDGTNFIVAWTDQRFDWDIYATAVAPDGNVLAPNGWGVGAGADTVTRDCDIATGSENILFVWEIDRFPDQEDIQGGRITIDDYLIIDNEGFNISLGAYAHANPDVAFDGTNYLAVWEDYRNGVAQVYGTRISAAGEILDPNGIYIGSNDTMKVELPRVTFNGTDFVVVWSFRRSNSYSGGGAMARVGTDGLLIDDPPISITSGDNSSMNFTACSDGNNTLIAWNAWNVSSIDVFGTLVEQNGVIGLPFIISDAENYQEYPDMAFNGTRYFAIWQDKRESNSNIFGTPISPDGVVLNPEGIEINNDQSHNNRPTIASDGSDFLVSWYSGSSAGESIYAAIIDQSGNVTVDKTLVYEASQFEYAQHTDVTFNGENYILSWQTFTGNEEDYNIMGASVDPLCSVNQIITIDDSDGNQFAPHIIAGNSGQILATYSGFTEEINNQPIMTSRSYGIFMDELIGVKENIILNFDFEIYPNPATNKFCVISSEFSADHGRVEIFDMNGKLLLEKHLPAVKETIEIDVNNFKSGVYFCTLKTNKGIATKKLIIQK